MKNKICLSDLPVGEEAFLLYFKKGCSSALRFMDLGFVKGTKIKVFSKSPFGDPRAYLVKGSLLALRKEDAEKIVCQRKSP